MLLGASPPDNNRDASNIVDFTTRGERRRSPRGYSPTAFECKRERAAAFLPTSGHDSHSANQTASGTPCSRLRVRFDVLSTYPDLSLGALYERRVRDVRMYERAVAGRAAQSPRDEEETGS